jgi:hypothetical protein
MVALYTDRQLRKDDVRMSNWDELLSEEQQQCISFLRTNWQELTKCFATDAANDVHCAVVVHARLAALAEEKGIALDLAQLAQSIDREPVAPAPVPDPSTPATQRVSTSAANTPFSRTKSVSSVSGGMSLGASPESSSSSTLSTSVSSVRRSPAEDGWMGADSPLSSGRNRVNPRQKEAYDLWHTFGMELAAICREMRGPPFEPLKETTVMYAFSLFSRMLADS